MSLDELSPEQLNPCISQVQVARHWRVEALYDCHLHHTIEYDGRSYDEVCKIVGQLCLRVTVDKLFVYRDDEKYRHIELR